MNSPGQIFEKYILSTYYTGEIRYYAYREVAIDTSLEGFYNFQEWHEKHKEEVNDILKRNELKLLSMKGEFKSKFKTWSENIQPKIPSLESLQYVGLFNSKGD
jgi:hypothetical protein